MARPRIKLAAHDLLGVRFAVNVFIAAALLWYLLRHIADTNPIWAIASMVAASEPQVKEAGRMFRSRITNVMIGCVVGLLFVWLGRTEWQLPFAMAVTVILSSYFVRIPAMWRQAPITAAIVIAGGLQHHEKLTAMEQGLHRVGEVLFGCIVGIAVAWILSKVWPLPEARSANASNKQAAS